MRDCVHECTEYSELWRVGALAYRRSGLLQRVGIERCENTQTSDTRTVRSNAWNDGSHDKLAGKVGSSLCSD